MAELTDKQRAFVAEYLVDLNATQAAIRAGYSEKTAAVVGHENLRKPKIAAAIQEAFEARIERTEITADRVLLEYARIAFSEMRQFAEWGPSGVIWKSSEELSEEAAACVAEVSETISEGGRTRRFKLHSKTSALSDLAKHLGLFGKDAGAGGASVNVNVNNAVNVEGHVHQERKDAFEELFREIDEYREAERSEGAKDEEHAGSS